MLEERDIRFLGDMFDKIEQRFGKIEQRFDEMERRFDEKLEKRLTENTNMILEELDRTRGILEKRIDQLDERLTEVEEYYHIRRLEDENVSMILQMHNELEKRVARLEEKVS